MELGTQAEREAYIANWEFKRKGGAHAAEGQTMFTEEENLMATASIRMCPGWLFEIIPVRRVCAQSPFVNFDGVYLKRKQRNSEAPQASSTSN